MGKLKTLLFILGGLVAVLCASILFFVPFPKTVEGSAEEFVCLWEDGTSTAEDSVAGIKILEVGREEICFERDGKRGIFNTGAEFRRAVDVFEGRDAFSLLTFRLGECSKIEHLALLFKYGNVCFCAEGNLVFDGTALSPTDRTNFDEIVILQDESERNFSNNSVHAGSGGDGDQ